MEIKEGDIITVFVDQNMGDIRWKLNKKVKVVYEMKSLRDKAINWVPFVYMSNYEDKIAWMDD